MIGRTLAHYHITTAIGTETLAVPRGRLVEEDGSRREFQSQALPRYARRTREVDEADPRRLPIAGASTRRIRKGRVGRKIDETSEHSE